MGYSNIKTRIKSLEDRDYVYKLDEFIKNKDSVLFITGLSGSGKSTLAKELEMSVPNSTIVELDSFEHAVDSNSPIINTYVDSNPQLKFHFDTHWKKTDRITFMREFDKFWDWLMIETSTDKFIIEGLQIITNVDNFKDDRPLIVKMTDAEDSHMRACNDSSREKFNPEFKTISLERSKNMQVMRDKFVSSHKQRSKKKGK